MNPESRRLLAELKVASLLIYPSQKRSAADREARDIIWEGGKQARPAYLRRVGQRLAELPAEHPVCQAVPANSVLVPVPRSTPVREGDLWPAFQIAEVLVSAGIGILVLPLLVRDEPVRRSTGARNIADREPPIRHYATISTVISRIGLLDPSAHYVLVDDVVTTGSTLIACASHLTSLAPEATIAAFAVARAERTRAFAEAKEMFSPTVQTIYLTHDAGRPWRE